VKGAVLLGTNLWHSDKLIQMARDNIQTAFITEGFFDKSPSGHVRQFVSGFRTAYGNAPGFIEAISYDTAMILFELAGRSDVSDGEDIRRELLTMAPFEGVTGKTTFDENREAVKDITILKIFQGTFQEVNGRSSLYFQ
jgi:ABC-type branched-subunit amino acid transport system substrate-binding protein